MKYSEFKSARLIIGMLTAVIVIICGCSKTTQDLDALESRDPLLRKAMEMTRTDNKDEAIALLRRAVEKKPGMALAHLRIALLYNDHSRDYSRAIYHYQRYLELRPDAEKAEMITKRVKEAETLLCAKLSGRAPVVDDEKLLLREENERLKKELHAVRRNLTELSAAAATKPSKVPSASAVPSAPEKSKQLSAEPSAAVERAKTSGRIYVVGPNDTLSSIASKVYQNPRLWRRIYDANRDVIGDNPAILKVGQNLVIPE